MPCPPHHRHHTLTLAATLHPELERWAGPLCCVPACSKQQGRTRSSWQPLTGFSELMLSSETQLQKLVMASFVQETLKRTKRCSAFAATCVKLLLRKRLLRTNQVCARAFPPHCASALRNCGATWFMNHDTPHPCRLPGVPNSACVSPRTSL